MLVSATMLGMQGVPIHFSFARPLARIPNPSPSHDKICLVVGCMIFAFMGIVFHILSEPQSPKLVVVWLKNTSAARTVGWLWARFWAWGALAWFVAGIAIPLGIGVAAMTMYWMGRCLVALGVLLTIIKLIHDALIEKRPRSEVAWIAVITGAIGLAVAYGCFWVISEIEWNHEMVITMTFKSSPVLVKREHSIQWEINSYFRYLKNIGFDLPIEIPPLGTNPPNSVIHVGGGILGPISTQSIFIPEDTIDNADNIRFAYSIYTFNRILVWPDMLRVGMTRAETEDDEIAAWIAECYFPASFAGHMVCQKGTPGYKWVEALWDIRNQLGQDYADGLLCYTVKLWGGVPSKDADNFDKFFRYRLVSGESVKDNPNMGREIDGIFKQHGLAW
jgi:hypothetical protein